MPDCDLDHSGCGPPLLVRWLLVETDQSAPQDIVTIETGYYPTVKLGTVRLRITPSPLQTDGNIDHLVNALATIWSELDVGFTA